MVPNFLSRKEAGAFLKERFGFGSKKSLDKLAINGGGPEFQKAGRLALYTPEALPRWALSRIGPPQLSTAQNPPTPAPVRARGRPRKSIPKAAIEAGEVA